MSQGTSAWATGRSVYGPDHDAWRDQVRRFLAREMEQNGDRWEEAGITDRAFWLRAGEQGLLAPQVTEEWGGPGLDISFNFVVSEEIAYAAAPTGFQTHSDVCIDYLLHYASDELKARWLARTVDGSAIAAIAMTEPGTGSDLRGIRTRARREGDEFVVSGSKTYISNGQNCDFVLTALKTEAMPERLSLLLIETDRPGFRRGRNLDKIGQNSADTSELFFDEVRVPATNLIGAEGAGLSMLVRQLPQERLSIAVSAQAGAQRAYDEAVAFVRERKAFGKAVIEFQNTRFVLADIKSQLQVGWAHLDWAIARHLAGELTPDEAAAAKLWHTEMQWKTVDASLQLHGGAGYMNEYMIARLWRDARVQRIYGGTSEIMKELIGRAL
ncbi:MAG: acyl-CoA dehydrogenase family protein [Pseudomonadota bacterium]